MFGWFRKYVRKIGIFGVEVEFHSPTEAAASKPEPADAPVQEPEKRPPPPEALRRDDPRPPDEQEKPMALRKCREPDCGNMVSTMAAMCPRCGCPTDTSPPETGLDELFPPTGSLEDRVRAHPDVQRLLNNGNWRSTAEAAILELVCGQRCGDDSRRATATWKQVRTVVEKLRSQSR